MSRPGFSPLTWLAAMLRSSDLSGQDKARLVAAAMLKYARADGTNAHPGRARLAEDLDLSVNTVDRALRRLVDAGWLVRTQSGSTSPRRNWADVYRLTVPPSSVSDQSPSQRDQSPNDVDQSPQLWEPSCLSSSTSIHLSDSIESGPPDSGGEQPWYGELLNLDEQLEWLSGEIGAFEGYEESTAQGMLSSGSHPMAVLNTLQAGRDGR